MSRGNTGDQKIEATDDHPFWVIGKGWKTTIELEVGDRIETDTGSPMTVASVTDEQRTDVTYNFTVADFHTYYVTERRVLVHNCSRGPSGQGGNAGDAYPSGTCPTCGGGTTSRETQIAQETGHSTREVKDAIHGVKREGNLGGGARNNPDVEVCTTCGEVYPQTDSGIGDSIGNIKDQLRD